MKKLLMNLVFLIPLSLFGQGAAPSSHLFYSNGNANSDIWMNSVNVPITTTYTYYSVMGWNTGSEGGGYCGIQDHPNGKVFIFSIWDPSNQLPIVGAYTGPGTQIENFGGEGTGLKSWNFTLGWSPNTWYNLVTRVWQYNSHTFFGFWSQDMNTGIWTHLVTMDYPVANVNFKGGNDAFIEDWIGSGANIRKVLFKDAWQRSTTGTWNLQKAVTFSSNSGDEVRNGQYNEAFNGGIESGAFFMQTGGNTTHAFPGRSTNLSVTNPATSPTITIGSASSFQAAYQPANQTINANWVSSQTKSPQFSYTIDIFNNPSYTGSPVLTATDKVPHQRAVTINASSLANGTYYTRLTIKDIFDQSSTPVYATITKTAAPTVAVTSPADNTNFNSPASITINATAADATGTITNVEFYNGATLIGSDNTSPHSFTWTNVGFGTYAVTAKATNNSGVSTSSLPVTVKVNSACNVGGTAFGTSPAYANGTSTYDKVFDGNTATFFDYSQANAGYAGLDFGTGKTMFVNTISFYPRSGNTWRMTGGKFQGSNTANFSSGVVDLYTITSEPANNAWQTVELTPTTGYRYVRYLSPDNGYCNIAEAKFCGDFSLANPAPTITYNGSTKVYGNAPFAMTATSNSPGAMTYSITAGGSFASINASTGQVTILGAGTVTVQVAQAASGSYAAGVKTATLTINKANLTATADAKSRVYNIANPAFTITYTGFVNGDNASVITTPTASTSAITTSNVGTYPITLTGGSAANYNISLVSGTLTITPATPTLAYTGPTSGTVNAVLALTATTNGTATPIFSVTNGTGTATLVGSNLTLNTAGTVTVTVSVAANGNYAAAMVNQTITINALIAPTITYNSVTKVYGNAAFAMTASSNSPGAMTYSITAGGSFASINASTGQVTILGAGTVTVQASQVASGSYSAATKTATLTINKASLTATADAKSRVYNTANPTLTLSFTGFVNGDNSSAITAPTASTAAITTSNVGTYPITLTGGSAANYNISLVSGTLTITPATPTLAYTGPTSGTVSAVLALTATTSSTATPTYSVTNGTGTATLVGSNLTLNTVGTVAVTVSVVANGNYAAATVNQTITINLQSCIPVTGTAFGTSPAYAVGYEYDKAFDGNTSTAFDNSSASGGYTGLDLGTAQVVTGIRYYPRTAQAVRMTGGKFQGSNTSSSAGFVDLYIVPAQPTYAWQDVSIPNTTAYRYYRYLSPTNGFCNVAEIQFCGSSIVAPTISYNSSTKVYGDAPFAMTASSNSPGAMTYSITSGGSFASINASTGQVTILGAGTVTVQVAQAASGSYAAATQSATLTINKANLTSTADNKSRVYNTANPAFTISYSGFVNGDNASVITAPTASTTAITTSNVGTYPITLTGGSAANYNISLVSGTLTITPATPTLTYTGPASGFVSSVLALTATTNSTATPTFSVTNGTGTASLAGSNLTLNTVGTVTVTVSVAANGNYFAAIVNQTITINAIVLPENALSLQSGHNVVIPSTEVNAILANSFTIEFWTRLTMTPSTNNKTLLSSNGRVNNLTTGFDLEFNTSNRLNLVFGNNTSSWISISNMGKVWVPNEWNHVAVVAVPGDKVYYYQNGVLVSTMAYTSYVANTLGLALGKSVYYGVPVLADFDDFRIWSKALTASEISQRMHYSLHGTEGNLVHYYTFDQPTGSTVPSKGSNTYNLALTNATLISSTAPVRDLPDTYETAVNGNWNVRNESNHALKVNTIITDYNRNVIMGNTPDYTYSETTPGSETYKINGGWYADGMGINQYDLSIDVSTVLPNYSTVLANAESFYLWKQVNQVLQIVSNGTFNGQVITFANATIDAGEYFIGWQNGSALQGMVTNENEALLLSANSNLSGVIKSSVRVYPNPSSRKFFINLTNCEEQNFNYRIMDLSGRVIEEKVVGKITNAAFEHEVKIPTVAPGTYLVHIHLDGKLFTEKIIIE